MNADNGATWAPADPSITPAPARNVVILVPGQQGGIDRLFEGLGWKDHTEDAGLHIEVFRTHGPLLRGVMLFPFRLLRFGRLLLSRRIDLCHINLSSKGSTVRKAMFGRLCQAFHVPYVVHLHGSRYREFYGGLGGFARRLVRRFFHQAAYVIVLGQVWKEFVTRDMGVEAGRAVVIPNAVRGPGSDAPTVREDPPVILFLGRLGERKGTPELIAALAHPRLSAAKWTAVLAGDGDVQEYQGMVAERGLSERVSLPGWVGPEAVAELLARSSILVLPSHAENLPLSMLEGMAYGLPPVVTPVGAVSDVIKDGVNGVLVPVRDPDAIATAVADLLEHPDRRARIGRAARKTFEEGYDARDYPAKLVRLYQKVIAGEGSAGEGIAG